MNRIEELQVGDLVRISNDDTNLSQIVRVHEIGEKLFCHLSGGIHTACAIADIRENITGDCRVTVLEMNIEKLTLI